VLRKKLQGILADIFGREGGCKPGLLRHSLQSGSACADRAGHG